MILRPSILAGRLGVSRATIYNMLHRGELPYPIRISANVVGWPEEQIEEWIRSRPVVGAAPAQGRDQWPL